MQTLKGQLIKMAALRQQRAQGMQNNLAQGMQNGLPQGMNPAQMGMMGGPNMQGGRPNQPQNFPSGFTNPQLQRPMQPTPIPMSQGPSSMGMNGTNPMNFQQGQMQPGQNTPQPNMQQAQPQGQQFDNQTIMQLTKRLMAQAKPEVLAKFRQDVEQWPPERKQQFRNQNIDPLIVRFRQQAEVMLRSGKINIASLQGQGANQNGGQMQQGGQPNQMQGQQMNMNQGQPNQNFDFNAIANQQMEALRVQDQGQQVVPASSQNQMMGFPGQNPQAGQSMGQRPQVNAMSNPLQRQAQAQAQAQVRAQLQQQQAQAAQRNANPLLQGQVGGLNLPQQQNPQQSPMPNLNRPIIPPGQPTTPQQRPTQVTPMMGQGQGMDNQVTQLMREVQQRAAATGQPLTEQMRLSMLPPELPGQVKAHMLKVPEMQFRNMLAGINMRRNGPMQNGQFPGGQPTPGQPNMMVNPAQALQMGMPGQMMNGVNMGGNNGMPMGQQTPNGMPGQPMPMGQRPGAPQQQRLQVAQNLLQQSPGIITATDNNPFPPNVLNAGIKQSVPPEVKTWAQLKQWATQNPALMPNIDGHKLLLLQVLHFQDQLLKQKAGMGNMPTPQQNGAGAIAPQAQMQGVPNQGPTRTPQPQPNMPNMGQIQISPQELQAFRARLPPNQQGVTDEQLRSYIMNQRMQARRAQQQQQAQQQQLANMQGRQGPQPQPPMPAQPPQVSRPPTAQPQPAQTPTQTKPATKASQPPKSTQPNGQNALNKGTKRSIDDSAETTNDAHPPGAAPPAPPMVASKSQQGLSNLTQEQLSKLSPNQQAQIRTQLLKAQEAKPQQRPPPTYKEVLDRMSQPEVQQRYKTLLMEEEQKVPKGQPVNLTPDARAQVQQLVCEKLPHLRKVEQALRVFVAGIETPQTQDFARMTIRARTALLRNINPQQNGRLHDEVTLTADQFKDNIRIILNFVGKVMARFNQPAPGQGVQQNQQQSQVSQTSQPAQLNAQNLKIVEQQNRQQKAPQAPTTDRPPFPLGGGQSPRGAPTYFDGALKVENLRLPDKKKQKLDSQASTPGAKASPRVGAGKDASPEMKRQQPPQRPVEQKPTFRCKTTDCDFSFRGFDTQAELDAHVKEAHAKIDDPLQYALDSMAVALDVDPRTGQSKTDPATARKQAVGAGRGLSQPTRPGQTPNVAQNVSTPSGQPMAATPMARVPTQPGVKSSPSTHLLKTPQTGAKVATPSTSAPAKATPSSITKPSAKETSLVAAANTQVEEDKQPFVPLSILDYSYDDVYGALDSGDPFTVLDIKDEDTSWALRDPSPWQTPESSTKDTPSTRQSDISENDNLQINIDIKDTDMPDAWLAAQNGEALPLDAQLSEDIQNLGVTLPPLNDDDMMLFYGENYLADLDAMDTKMMESLGTLDPTLLTVN